VSIERIDARATLIAAHLAAEGYKVMSESTTKEQVEYTAKNFAAGTASWAYNIACAMETERTKCIERGKVPT
jgi:predicted secreted protein